MRKGNAPLNCGDGGDAEGLGGRGGSRSLALPTLTAHTDKAAAMVNASSAVNSDSPLVGQSQPAFRHRAGEVRIEQELRVKSPNELFF